MKQKKLLKAGLKICKHEQTWDVYKAISHEENWSFTNLMDEMQVKKW